MVLALVALRRILWTLPAPPNSESCAVVIGTTARSSWLPKPWLPDCASTPITSQTQVLSTAQAVTQTLTILLASVAAISLLVGGIGVMNIMLVSVTERTSEIGLRKALGATPGDLFRQFVIEAGTLTALGGLLGVATGLAVGYIVPRAANIAVTITPLPVLTAVAVAVAVGLVFGVYPALRAARLAPIEALRAQ